MASTFEKFLRWNRAPKADPRRATVLIRSMVGAVFLTEGIQKFLYPAVRGAGRFRDIGFPLPELLGYTVGSIEVVCGALVLVGFATRMVAFPLAVIMSVAIVVTKIPILFGHGFGPFGVRELSTYGFWSMAHEMRTDWAMFLGSIYLCWVGGGVASVDEHLLDDEKG